jgi:hypothetical protein
MIDQFYALRPGVLLRFTDTLGVSPRAILTSPPSRTEPMRVQWKDDAGQNFAFVPLKAIVWVKVR